MPRGHGTCACHHRHDTHTHMTCMHATIYTCSLWLVPIEYVHATRHRRTHTHTTRPLLHTCMPTCMHVHTHTTHAYTWMTCHELTSYVHANTYTCRRRGYTLMTCHEATEHVHATTDMTHTHMTCMHATI